MVRVIQVGSPPPRIISLDRPAGERNVTAQRSRVERASLHGGTRVVASRRRSVAEGADTLRALA
jgi:hypothetical protein